MALKVDKIVTGWYRLFLGCVIMKILCQTTKEIKNILNITNAGQLSSMIIK